MLKAPVQKTIHLQNHEKKGLQGKKDAKSCKKWVHKERDDEETIATQSHYEDEERGDFQHVQEMIVSVELCGYQYILNCFNTRQVTHLLLWIDSLSQLQSHKLQIKLVILDNLSQKNSNLQNILDQLLTQYSQSQKNKLFSTQSK